jgi:hypothetical protein
MEMIPGATYKRSGGNCLKMPNEIWLSKLRSIKLNFSVTNSPPLETYLFVNPGARPMSKQAQQESQQLLPVLGQLVSVIFFWGDHITQNVPRGPFTESTDWIRAHLTFALTGQERIIKNSDDEAEIENAQDAKEIAERLLKLLPSIHQIFTSNKYYITPEPSILFDDDLSMQNILDDNDGKITGIVDWEFVSALPFWRACQLPEFLEGRDKVWSRKWKITLQMMAKKTL